MTTGSFTKFEVKLQVISMVIKTKFGFNTN